MVRPATSPSRDFDGNGSTEFAVYRPSTGSGS